MPNQKVIIISGDSFKVGKTTLAHILSIGDYNTKILPMALQLKNELSKLMNKDFFVEGTKNLVFENGKTGRDLLVEYGNSKRKEDPLYWCKRWRDLAENFPSSNLIIDDVRFLNEKLFIKSLFPQAIHYHVLAADPQNTEEEYSDNPLLMSTADFLYSWHLSARTIPATTQPSSDSAPTTQDLGLAD